jgi:hypothetical protein
MTYSDPNDPNDLRLPPKRTYKDTAAANNTTMWVVGALAMLAIIAVLIYAIANTGTQTASTTPGATTGGAPTTAGADNSPQPSTTLPTPRAPAAPPSNR